MPYTRKDILDSHTPYTLFEDGDTLAEHRPILDTLTAQDKKKLAIQIILACPKDNLKNYGHAIRALASAMPGRESFHTVISKVHQLKTRILSMLDHRNKKPYLFFLDAEALDLCNEFPELAITVITGNEVAIAERLALLTPDTERSKVIRNANTAFPQTTLAHEIGTAFALKRYIQELLGANPERFFTRADFNRETCMEYSELFTLITGQEATIGAKLANTTGETRKAVEHNLHLLITSGHDEANPFKLIADNISAPAASSAPAAHREHGFFAAAAASRASEPSPTPANLM